MTEQRFQAAADTYRSQILDPIKALMKPSPFAASTLACCAIDLLSHVLYDPQPSKRETYFKKTVKKRLEGYSDETSAQVLYDLRCGLVHEFRTASRDGGTNALLSDGFDGELRYHRGDAVISVKQFCEAVCGAFEEFFRDASPTEQSAFIDRAELFVSAVPLETASEGSAVSDIKFSSLTVPVSGSSMKDFSGLEG